MTQVRTIVINDGIPGANAPYLQMQFSADGLTNWSAVYTEGDDYARFSLDDGVTWGDAVKITGDVTKIEINEQTDDYTVTIDDAGGFVSMNKATAVTLTVPPDASVDFPIGTIINIEQAGIGQVTVSAGVGVTINAYLGATKVVGQYAVAGIMKKAANTWSFFGNISL